MGLLDFAHHEHIDSWYHHTASGPTFAPLHDALDADVCVVGGGYTGLSAALELAERGLNVVLLEGARLGWAASGRNGGQVLTDIACGMDSVRAQLPEAAAITIALWFHDAIYELQRHDNEERSAAWAAQALRDAGASEARAEQVRRLVLATRHQATPQAEDEAWLVDIDLAILGAAPARFAEYEAQIRAEYGFVPEARFRAKRAEILRGFLARPHIFSTAHFRARLEQPARANLERALA